MKPDIWIDLTDLFYWKGHFTGVQRVAYNYAARYSEQDARFFIYSSYYKKFVEVPFGLVRRSSAGAVASTLPLRVRLKDHAIKSYKTLPRGAQKVAKPIARRTFDITRKTLIATFFRAGSQSRLKKFPSANFKAKDQVLILGAGWNEEGILDSLAQKKQQLKLNVIVHLNDILPVYQPQLFSDELPPIFAEYVDKALKISDAVTVISKATKNDVIKYCEQNKLQQPHIEIVRLGEDGTRVEPQKPSIANLKPNFILSVGTFEIRKNYILLYQAVKLAKINNVKLPQIVISGRKGWLAQDLLYVVQNDLEVKNQLLYLDDMSDNNLAWLYDNCLFTVFPSLYEGWGLPIAESLSHGKFCLSSNTSSMPEIAGQLIDYFNPFDAQECLAKIQEYSKKDLSAINQKITSQYRALSWDDSFKQLTDFVSRTS